MKKKPLLMIAVAVMLTACNSDDFTGFETAGVSGSATVSGGSATLSETGTTDIATFDIVTDATSLASETEVVDATNEDFVESMLAEETDGLKTLTITYNGSTAEWTYCKKSGVVIATQATAGNSYEDEDVAISVSGAHVTVNAAKKIDYILQGTSTDGNFKLYSEKKFILDLNGLTLANKSGAAINIQKGSDGDKRCYLRVKDGTANTLSDGATYVTTDGEDEKGVIFSEGKLLISGTGTLSVKANGKHGIVSDDYVYLHAGTNTDIRPAAGCHGIKANDAVYIAGGVHNIICSGDAPKGVTADSLVCVTGGRTTIINSGKAVYDSEEQDYSQPSCVKSDSIVYVKGGELLCKATGNGGKGIRAARIYTQDGGTVKIITTGQTVGSSSSGMGRTMSSSSDAEPKGLHVGKKSDTTGQLTVNGGKLIVRCTGGEGAEGIESKNWIVINGGQVESYSYDDAINAAKSLTINGGYVYGNGTNNDGIDSNGNITITGGVVVGCGASQPEDGIDCDQNTLAIKGGIVVGIGGSTSTPTSNYCTQPSLVTSTSLSSGAVLVLRKSDGTNVAALKVPSRYNGTYTVLISAPGLATGNTYSVVGGATISGTSFQGVVYDALSVSGGSASYSYTQSSMVVGGGSSMGGGMMPGERPF